MTHENQSRRDFLKAGTGTLAATILSGEHSYGDSEKLIRVNPEPLFELSPYLYLQFMEPLGTTDGSVSAAWDYLENAWREDVIETTKALGPTMVRWGGCLSSYYKWKEGVGPRESRKPMLNLLWGGVEPNQVGTHEFAGFCRQVGAEPLLTVNFESDGRQQWATLPNGDRRWGDAQEAAEWVDYCNNPGNAMRIRHGVKEPYNVKYWQIGNETSYDRNGFDVETGVKKTIEFARAMKEADPSIQLIGWGDSGWGKKMIEGAGEYLDFIAIHHMYNPDSKPPVLAWNEFRKDPDRTWEQLMQAYVTHENKIMRAREEIKDNPLPIAMTECHYTIPGRNRCEVLSTWAAGVSYARLLNVHERHGDLLKMATVADFCGTRWMVNAVMIPVPNGRRKAFLMPVARVMQLYRHHSGKQFIKVIRNPDGLDITASRTDNRVFLHVVNTKRTQSVDCRIAIDGRRIISGKVYEICTEPEFEINANNADELSIREKAFPANPHWSVPAASVSAIELKIA